MDVHDGMAYIDRVKLVIHEQLATLDPTATVEDTHYFNHSAIPDFVVTWPGEKGERVVYLRDSYASIEAGEDERYLAEDEPVLLSLGIGNRAAAEDVSRDLVELGEVEQKAQVEGGVGELFFDHDDVSDELNPRTLVTDVSAVEVIRASESSGSPLSNLVRANFIRGAKGFMDQDRAENLVAVTGSDWSEDAQVRALIAESFVEDAALRISRTASLIALALSARGQALHAALAALGGKLSIAEIRVLLPWLIVQPRAAENLEFWRHIGALMTFKELEGLRHELEGLDLTPLIRANADQWSAKWAYLGLATPRPDGEPPSGSYWSFDGRCLGLDLGTERILIALNGQLIKARESSSSATWELLRGPLEGHRLSGVSLRGIRRSVTVDAEQSPDVRGDVEDVTASLEDHYFVTHATVRVPAAGGRDGLTDVRIDFGGGVVRAQEGASILDLTRIAGQVLKYRAPATAAQLTAIVGSDEFDADVSGDDTRPQGAGPTELPS